MLKICSVRQCKPKLCKVPRVKSGSAKQQTSIHSVQPGGAQQRQEQGDDLFIFCALKHDAEVGI